jgi:hypothetical protein
VALREGLEATESMRKAAAEFAQIDAGVSESVKLQPRPEPLSLHRAAGYPAFPARMFNTLDFPNWLFFSDARRSQH